MSKRFTIIFLIILAMGLILPQVSEAGIVPCGQEGGPACQFCHILVVISNIIDFAFKVVGPITILFIAIAGIMVLTGAGSTNLVARGKKSLYYALSGLAIIFLSWVIINSVIVAILNPEVFPAPWNVWKVECPITSIDPSTASSSSYDLINDADGDGEASSGDTIKYSLGYTNTSDTNLSNLTITIDYDQEHIFAITNISDQGIDNGDEIKWQIQRLDSGESVTVFYEFILSTDLSDLSAQHNQADRLLANILSIFIGKQVQAQGNAVSLQNTITINSDQTTKQTFNDYINVIAYAITVGDPEDINENPVYLLGYYEEPDDSSSKWSSYDWYFNKLADNNLNAVRILLYNSNNPFYSVSPWENNNCAQPNDKFYTDWLKPTINSANSKGLYVILTLYHQDWTCSNKTQENREKTYNKIIDYLNLPKEKVIIEINWEENVVNDSWLQDQAQYFENKDIFTIITDWHYDDHQGASNPISFYAGRHRDWNRDTSLEYFDSGKPTIWTERFFTLQSSPNPHEPMSRFEARRHIYRDALTVRQPILFYYLRWSTPDEGWLPESFLSDAGYAVELSQKIPWRNMSPQERAGKTVGNTGYWSLRSEEAALGWVNDKNQVNIDITDWNGSYDYWWFNPRNGNFNYVDTISGNPINNTFTVSTPDSSQDWAFVLIKADSSTPAYHNECSNGVCEQIEGAGSDQCVVNNDCRHNECVNNVCEQVLTPGTDECNEDVDCQPSSFNFNWSCDDKFSGDCFYVTRCEESVLWMQDGLTSEHKYSFDVDSEGEYNCQLEVITGTFRYEEKRYQDNETTDVYINNQHIGTTEDLYCNTGDGANCKSCNHVVTNLSKDGINISTTGNEVKLIGNDSHGLVELKINCAK